MPIQHDTKAVRAIAGVFLSSTIQLIVRSIFILFGALIAGTLYLSLQVSGWWAVFLIPLIVVTIVAFFLQILLRIAIIRILPRKLTKAERKSIKSYLKKVIETTDYRNTWWPLLFAKTSYELLRHKELRTIRAMIDNTQSLKPEYQRIRDFFA